MSIQILSDSFKEHRTVDSLEVTTRYMMSWYDYYAGEGDLYNSEWEFLYTMYLPWEGDNYGLYYNTDYLGDCVLVDITVEPTEAVREGFDGEGVDNTGLDRHKAIIVTYTWSNSGLADTKRKNEASSWKMRFDTNVESKTVDTFVYHTKEGLPSQRVKFDWAKTYYNYTDPDVILTEEYKSIPAGTSHGYYSTVDSDIQRKFIEETRDSIPQLERRQATTTCSLTAYSSNIIGGTLVDYVGKVNKYDWVEAVYNQREAALIKKNKLPGQDSNNFINQDDTGKWMFVSWNMEDLGNGFFEYEFIFEYSKDGWNNYIEYVSVAGAEATTVTIPINQYESIDFYNILLSGMDKALPNDRNK